MSEPSQHVLRFLSRVQRLESMPRAGWVVSGVTSPESVAAHSYEVALLAMWIADAIPEEVDVERLLRMALLHDVAESIITDIPTPTKRLIGRELVHEAERRAFGIVLENAPADWGQYVDEYEARESLEARIVKSADTIQMLARALAYQRMGRGDLERFFRPRRDDHGITFVREVLDEIARMHVDNDWFVADFD